MTVPLVAALMVLVLIFPFTVTWFLGLMRKRKTDKIHRFLMGIITDITVDDWCGAGIPTISNGETFFIFYHISLRGQHVSQSGTQFTVNGATEVYISGGCWYNCMSVPVTELPHLQEAVRVMSL